MADFDLRKQQRLACQGDQRAMAKLQWYAEKCGIGVDWTDQKVFPLLSALEIAKYFRGGWNGKFTLVNTETKLRHSFRLKRAKKKPNHRDRIQDSRPSWVRLWNGFAWVWIGFVNLRAGPTKARFEQAHRNTPETALRAIKYILHHVNNITWPHPQMEFWHHGMCGRCGRDLIVESYKRHGKLVAGVAMGLGPVCARKAATMTSKKAT